MISKRPIYFLLILLVLGIISYIYPSLTGNSISNYYQSEEIILSRVVDGDTIKDQFNQSYRLLGINTPEKTMPYSSEAANFLKQFEGKTLTLMRDKDDTDKYNRKLRYVFYKDRFLNKEILAGGLANSYYTTGLIYEKELLAAEKQAKSQGLGIWQKSQEKCAEDNCIILKELNPKEEFFTIKNSCSFTCNLDGWFVKDLGRNTFFLASLTPNQEKTYSSDKEVWNNDHDRFTMYDQDGFFVFDYEY
jgi:endonuclease YncB( thermonuclease family)